MIVIFCMFIRRGMLTVKAIAGHGMSRLRAASA
jgi:hypothetical protein